MPIKLHLIANPLAFHLIERLISTSMEKGTVQKVFLDPIGSLHSVYIVCMWVGHTFLSVKLYDCKSVILKEFDNGRVL